MTNLLERLGDDSLVYAQKLNPVDDTVLLVEMTADELANHSFLDDRIFRPDMPFEWVSWSDFEAQAAALPDRAPSYIFHIGHCGSTLLSRLVTAATGVPALREPLPLRFLGLNRVDAVVESLDANETRRRLGILEKTWARGERGATVKATSMCTNLISEVNPVSQIVFIYQPAETHLAVILAGENAMQDLAGFGQNRHRRLAAITAGLPALENMSIGELAAMTWLAEVATASRALESREAFLLDFDAFLAQPESMLEKASNGLGLTASADQCMEVVSGPIMRSYSKAPEHSYGPKLRDNIIADSQRRNAAEISKGLELVERFRSTTCGEDWR